MVTKGYGYLMSNRARHEFQVRSSLLICAIELKPRKSCHATSSLRVNEIWFQLNPITKIKTSDDTQPALSEYAHHLIFYWKFCDGNVMNDLHSFIFSTSYR